MKSIFRNIQIGFIFLFAPLVIIGYILKFAWPFVEKLSKPVARILPFHDVAGEVIDFSINLLFIILISFLVGLILDKTLLKKWVTKEESLIKKIFPGYSLYKNFSSISSNKWKTAVFEADLSYYICFVVEELPDDFLLVYEPSTPNTYAGNIVIRKREQIKFIDIPFQEAVKLVREYGIGFSEVSSKHNIIEDIAKGKNNKKGTD